MVGGGLSTVITVVRPDVAVAALLIASLVKDNLLSSLAKKISSMLNAFLLDTAKAPIALGGYMLKMLTQFGYSFIAGHESPKDLVQEVNEQEWVMTLLSLDDAVFPKANKDQIRRIVGMIPILEVEESLLTESTPSTACASVPALGK
jgi:hypothetical protein